jgi:hypothetical protein
MSSSGNTPVPNKTATVTSDKCTTDVPGTLYPGVFTFGTDQPVYPPWYMGDNPASGEGFEAALAYAGRRHGQVVARGGRQDGPAAEEVAAGGSGGHHQLHRGDVPVEVYNTNGDAKMALSNGEIDAVVTDLPTAFTLASCATG